MTLQKIYDYLFTRNVPDADKWVWGNGVHIMYLVLTTVAIVLLVRHMGRIPEERQDRTIKILAVLVFLIWIVPPALMCIFPTGERWIDHLPLHLCTSASVLIPIGLWRRSPVLLNYGYGLGIPGAAAAILFPGEMFRYMSSWGIHYFLHNVAHVLPIVACLAPIAMGWWQPKWKYYPSTVGIGVLSMAVAYPVNKLTGSNYFFVNWPEKGTILESFGSVLGRSMYIPVLIAVAAAVIAAMFGIWSAVHAIQVRRARGRKDVAAAPA